MKEKIEKVIYSEPEKYEGPCLLDRKKCQMYEGALLKLTCMKEKGLCDFSYDSIAQPYLLHCIVVEWKEKDAMIEITGKDIADVCELIDSVVIDIVDGSWQLSSELYKQRGE